MDYSVFNRRLTVLHEADSSKYGIPDEVFDETDQPNNQNDVPEEQMPENAPTEEVEDAANEDQNNNDTENNDSRYNIPDETFEDGGENPDDQGEEDPDQQPEDAPEPESEEEENSIPKLTILNLPERDKKLNNLNLLKQFNELSRNISDNLNSNIINITVLNKKQRQILDFVSDNLFNMVTDIKNYVLYKYDDVYEENVITYNAFLKRYHTALQLVRQIVDEQMESDQSNSK